MKLQAALLKIGDPVRNYTPLGAAMTPEDLVLVISGSVGSFQGVGFRSFVWSVSLHYTFCLPKLYSLICPLLEDRMPSKPVATSHRSCCGLAILRLVV